MGDVRSPRRIAAALADPRDVHHGDALAIVKAYGKRWKRSMKRSPPTHLVLIPPNSGGIEACCVGWSYILSRGGFVCEIVAEGIGPNRRQQARDAAWDVYEEIWDQANKALDGAGVFKSDPVRPQ